MSQPGESLTPTPVSAAEAHPPHTPEQRRPGSRLRWLVANFEEVVTAILLAVMLGSVGLSVFCRYVLQMPLSWTEEVVLLCMVWVVFLGASMATKNREHIAIDVLLTVAPRPVARGLEILSLALTMGVLAILVWYGTLLIGATQYVTTTALGIPTMYIYAAVPVSAILMLIYSVRNLSSLFRR